MAYYTRYNRGQHYSAEKRDAWIYAQKLHCDLDVYDAQSRSVVWGTYRLSQYVEVDGELGWQVLGFAKSPANLRNAFREAKPETWTLSHYDWASKSWTSVKHS